MCKTSICTQPQRTGSTLVLWVGTLLKGTSAMGSCGRCQCWYSNIKILKNTTQTTIAVQNNEVQHSVVLCEFKVHCRATTRRLWCYSRKIMHYSRDLGSQTVWAAKIIIYHASSGFFCVLESTTIFPQGFFNVSRMKEEICFHWKC